MQRYWLLSALLLICTTAAAYELKGTVVSVVSGDTITILDANHRQHKVRFADIDAPEKDQPFGSKSKQFLRSLVLKKQAVADCSEKDNYRRNVCTVRVGDIDVSRRLIETGHAWVYEQYNKRADLPVLQRQAQSGRVGLWALPEADIIAPALWRHDKGAVAAQVRALKQRQSAPASQSNYQCGAKRYCSQMSSCEEAYFYLNQCGLSRLDKDGDGVPCETVCGR